MNEDRPTRCADDDSPWLVCKSCVEQGQCQREREHEERMAELRRRVDEEMESKVW